MFKTWNLSVITLSAYLDFPTPLSPTIKIFSVVRTSFSIVPRSTPLLQSVLIPQTFNLLLKSTEIFRYIFSFRHCYFLQETRLLLWRKTADIYTRGDEGPYGASTSILIKFSLIARLRLFGEHKQRKRINHVYYVYSFSLFVSSKRRFATTIAQHNVATVASNGYNIVPTLQSVLCWKSSLPIVPCDITLLSPVYSTENFGTARVKMEPVPTGPQKRVRLG